MYIPIISAGSSISVGSYKVVYNIKEGTPEAIIKNIPILTTPREISVLGKTIILQKTELQAEKGKYNIYIDVLSNPIPLIYLAGALIFVLGLGITYLIFDKIYTLVDESKVFLTIAVVFIFGYLIIKQLRK